MSIQHPQDEWQGTKVGSKHQHQTPKVGLIEFMFILTKSRQTFHKLHSYLYGGSISSWNRLG